MLVSVIIGLLNEEYYLPKLIKDLQEQTYPKNKIELVFIDGMSTDKSWDILTKFREEDEEFYDIVLLKNPKVILSAGMNIGIKNATGECFLKVDCHSQIPSNFIEKNVEIINEGEFVCGGPRPNIIEEQTFFKNTLLSVEEAMFGSGIANYRKSSRKKYVSSVFQGMYRREIFEQCGLLDEFVGRVEDNELHYRIRKHGYRIRYNNDIVSYQFTRPTYKRMLKQKYSNGYWIGKVSHVYPRAFSIFHFVPLLFVLAIVSCLYLSIFDATYLLILCGTYGVFLLLSTIISLLKNIFNITDLLMPFLIFGVHLAYGIGTLVGIVSGFKWKKDYLINGTLEYLEKSNLNVTKQK